MHTAGLLSTAALIRSYLGDLGMHSRCLVLHFSHPGKSMPLSYSASFRRAYKAVLRQIKQAARGAPLPRHVLTTYEFDMVT